MQILHTKKTRWRILAGFGGKWRILADFSL